VSELIGRRLGQYEVREVIRRGGMSTVYKAWQESLGRWVAVKVLANPGDAQFAARFAREARSIAQLQHPNIVPIYDYGQQDEQVYLVVQYVEGGHTLADQLGELTDPVRAVEIVSRLLAGVGYAHARGIIHRDVKPDNVLMPAPTWPMLADFGVAKLLAGDGQTLTQKGLVIGTAAYMAPEQAFGLPVDARTDLYATGIVLYELLCGQVPFDAENPAEVLMKQAYEVPPPPRARNPAIPEPLERALLMALAKEADERYATAPAMTAALREAVGLGPTATPPSVPGAEPQPAEAERRSGWLAATYEEGVQAFTEGRWAESVDHLRRVAQEDSGYEDVRALLSAAIAADQDASAAEAPKPAPPAEAGPAPASPGAPPASPAPAPARAQPAPPPPPQPAPPPPPQGWGQPPQGQAPPGRPARKPKPARQVSARDLERLQALGRRTGAGGRGRGRGRGRALVWLLLLAAAVAGCVALGIWLGHRGVITLPGT
jgi:eukaryotic-like serine/threonine-protein kinase